MLTKEQIEAGAPTKCSTHPDALTAWQQPTDAKLLADTIARYLRQLGPYQLGREGATLLFKAEIALRKDNQQ